MKKFYVAVNFNNKYAQDKNKWGNKDYHYKTMMPDLVADDLVVVETVNGYQVAKVNRYIPESDKATKYIVQVIDIESHEELIVKTEKISRINEEIEKRLNLIKKRKEIEEFAKNDATLKALLETLDELEKE